MKMRMDIRFKKCGISNQPNVCIFDDPCLSKFGALRGACPHPGRVIDRLGGYDKIYRIKFEAEYLRHLAYEGAKSFMATRCPRM